MWIGAKDSGLCKRGGCGRLLSSERFSEVVVAKRRTCYEPKSEYRKSRSEVGFLEIRKVGPK